MKSLAQQRPFLLFAVCLAILQFVVVVPVVVVASPVARPQEEEFEFEGDPEVIDGAARGGGGVRCRGKLRRQAWHTMTNTQKKKYIDAELCLMWQTPSRTTHPAAVSVYDDFQGEHQLQAYEIHDDGWFLAFHRYYIWAHEKLLREDCGYRGAHPYWDETHDSAGFTSSSIFSATTGFGGTGTPGAGTVSFLFDWPASAFPAQTITASCITTGPFANYTLHIGPGTLNTAHCISRDVNDGGGALAAAPNINDCLAQASYAAFWPCVNGLPHGAGHGGVGGEMTNPISSPGDPMFYMHHAWIDKLWWDWQRAANVASRKTELAGYTSVLPIALPGGGGGTGYVNATLGDVLHLGGLVRTVTVGETHDWEDGLLKCVEYV
ncbi:hypothetical protein DFH27DRAFT_561879 [Peziza echinospora]|nr:hypothetical protein DFH27DRAFT_561879 [Peziza echinospora]